MTEQILRHSKNQLFVETSKLLNSTLNLDELLDVILNLSARTMEAQASSLLLSDKRREKLKLHVSSGEKGGRKKKLELRMGEGIAGWVAEHGQPVISNRVKEDPRYSPELEKQIGFSIDSLICVPLLRRGKLIGVVTASNKMNGKKFDQEDLVIFSSLADQIAIALDNSYLFGRLKKKSLEIETLLEVEKSLSSSLNLNELLELILDSLLKVVRYDAVAIFLIDKDKQEIEHIKARGFDPVLEPDLQLKIGQGIAGWAAKTQKSLIVPNVKQDPRYIEARVETQSAMAVPIISQKRMIGVFSLESDEPNAYGEDDLELLEAFASLAAISLERARQHEEILEKRKLEEELSIAKRIQQSFLPRKKVQLPGFDISGINIPSEKVGGDYYDFIPVIENQMGIAIGDVSGKGVPASLFMVISKTLLKTEALRGLPPDEVLSHVNDLLYPDNDTSMFVTVFCVILDIETGELQFANGGHNPPLIRSDGEGFEFVQMPKGFVVGPMPDMEFGSRKLTLKKGDVIFIYTDGVTEAMNPESQQFSDARLKQCLSGLREKDIKDCRKEPYKQIFSSK